MGENTVVAQLQEMDRHPQGNPLNRTQETFARVDDGRATLFLVEIEPGRKAYRYDVDIVLLHPRYGEKSLAKGSDDGLRSRNRILCYHLLAAAFSKSNGFGTGGEIEVVYDCKSTLYTSKPIDPRPLRLELTSDEVDTLVRTYTGQDPSFRVSIIENVTGHELDLGDLSQYVTKESLIKENRSLRTFLEMAVSMFAVNQELYFPVGAGKAFQVQGAQDIGRGMLLRAGLAKGVRIVKNYGNPCPALVLDYKVCPFFKPLDLMETIQQFNRNRIPQDDREWHDVARFIEDIRVELTYSLVRNFGIGGVSDFSIQETRFDYNGEQISVYDYFSRTLRMEVQHPEWPAVYPQHKPNEQRNYYPIEFCRVIPDQRVPIEKMDRVLSERLLRENSVPPQQRMDSIIQHADRMQIFDENPVLASFGIRVLRDSNQINIGVRHPPRIQFMDMTVDPNPTNAEWKSRSRNMRFLQSHPLKNWIVLYHKQKPDEDIACAFVQQFLQAANERGIQIVPPGVPEWDGEQWQHIFRECTRRDVRFVLLIDSLQRPSHGVLKLMEAMHKVVTQHVSLERARDVVNGKRAILENIMNKTNSKLFGINYVPQFRQEENLRFSLDRNTLVLGYDVANPPPCSGQERRLLQSANMGHLHSIEPAVIGITANMAVHPHNFVGDYFYQEARRDYIDLDQLAERMKWVLERTLANRPNGGLPECILVLRNGLSEGQFARSVEIEMSALRKGCAMFKQTYQPHFVFVIGTKRHFKKFFAKGAGRLENMKPCSVVSRKFVREDCPELFMQSHYPLKGVGKPVEYSILVNEAEMTLDELEALLNSLCFSHQIVNSAVSLPEPIYQADELAKRGRENFGTMKRVFNDRIPRRGEANIPDPETLTEMLGYGNSELISTRFTA